MGSYEEFKNPSLTCSNVYCIDRANARCKSMLCCTCVCSKSGFPYADLINKVCTSNPVSSQAPSTTAFESTNTPISKFNSSTLLSTGSVKTNGASFQRTTTLSTIQTIPKHTNSTESFIAQRQEKLPVLAIAGSVVGFIIFVLIIGISTWFWRRRHKPRSKPKEESNEQEKRDEKSSYEMLQYQPETEAKDNGGNTRDSSQHYHSPTDLRLGQPTIQDDHYYSSAAVLNKPSKKGKTLEYSYARNFSQLGEHEEAPALKSSEGPDLYAYTGNEGDAAYVEPDSHGEINPYYEPAHVKERIDAVKAGEENAKYLDPDRYYQPTLSKNSYKEAFNNGCTEVFDQEMQNPYYGPGEVEDNSIQKKDGLDVDMEEEYCDMNDNEQQYQALTKPAAEEPYEAVSQAYL
ncbi:uncharacterized protein LOC135692483 isoform X1 [Rhopilema esculentum]|uniref:uncharacterized protein LOC135692483 isoform X1 n=1 Tax=Rhopilema esculentum TaxID=499914 RepID=UPI0031D4C340